MCQELAKQTADRKMEQLNPLPRMALKRPLGSEVEGEISEVKGEISEVVSALKENQRKLEWEKLEDEKTQLRDEKKQLWDKEKQLRDKEKQLRDEKKQLRDKEKQLRDQLPQRPQKKSENRLGVVFSFTKLSCTMILLTLRGNHGVPQVHADSHTSYRVYCPYTLGVVPVSAQSEYIKTR